jgi:hypothetical protein
MPAGLLHNLLMHFEGARIPCSGFVLGIADRRNRIVESYVDFSLHDTKELAIVVNRESARPPTNRNGHHQVPVSNQSRFRTYRNQSDVRHFDVMCNIHDTIIRD